MTNAGDREALAAEIAAVEARAEQRIAAAESERAAEHAAKLDAQAVARQLRSDTEELAGELEETLAALRAARADAEEQREKYVRLDEHLVVVITGHMADVEALRAEHAGQIEALTVDRDDLAAQVRARDEQLIAGRRDGEVAARTIATLTADVEHTRHDLADAVQAGRTAERDRSDALARLDVAEVRHHDLRQRVDELRAEVNQAHGDLAEARSGERAARSDVATLAARLAALAARLAPSADE